MVIWTTIMMLCPIACKVKKDNSLYITAEGLAMSCCWTAGRMYKWWLEDPNKRTNMGFYPR